MTDEILNRPPLVNIVILNWNGWKYTIKCLESVFRNEYPNYRVIVCDNNSEDGSLEFIKAWAEGRLEDPTWQSDYKTVGRLPTVSKPIPYKEYNIVEAFSYEDLKNSYPPLVLIQTGANKGFAGGNNVGIRYALGRKECEYIWLLNNDTIIAPDSLSYLISAVIDSNKVSLASSRITFMHDPARTWFEGGIFNPWLAMAKHVKLSQFETSRYQFLTGCALLIPRKVLETIGLLDESFFLYAEDIDFSIRAVKSGISLKVVPGSNVEHFGGASSKPRSPRAYSEYVHNIIRVIRRYHGIAPIPSIFLFHFLKVIYLGFSGRSFLSCKAYFFAIFKGIRASTSIVVSDPK